MNDADRVALLESYQDNSYCPLHARDRAHGRHPRCKFCRFSLEGTNAQQK